MQGCIASWCMGYGDARGQANACAHVYLLCHLRLKLPERWAINVWPCMEEEANEGVSMFALFPRGNEVVNILV